jgi:hypothetical protein
VCAPEAGSSTAGGAIATGASEDSAARCENSRAAAHNAADANMTARRMRVALPAGRSEMFMMVVPDTGAASPGARRRDGVSCSFVRHYADSGVKTSATPFMQ